MKRMQSSIASMYMVSVVHYKKYFWIQASHLVWPSYVTFNLYLYYSSDIANILS